MPDIPLPEDLSTHLKDLERRIRTLETAPRLRQATVTNGTTTVVDGTGVIKTQFGLLDDGSYGIGVLQSGVLVNLADFVFGLKYSISNTTVAVSSLTPIALSPGPSVTVQVGLSGKVLVALGSYIGLNNTNQTGFYGFQQSGINYPLVSFSNSSSLIAGSVSSQYLVSGLSSGPLTITSIAYVSTGSANFSFNYISAQPY